MSHKTILVVDDEPNSLFVTSQILMDQSYQVVTADNGKQALDMLRKEKVNAVITDERMPGMSGMDVLREAKNMIPGFRSSFSPVMEPYRSRLMHLKLAPSTFLKNPSVKIWRSFIPLSKML